MKLPQQANNAASNKCPGCGCSRATLLMTPQQASNQHLNWPPLQNLQNSSTTSSGSGAAEFPNDGVLRCVPSPFCARSFVICNRTKSISPRLSARLHALLPTPHLISQFTSCVPPFPRSPPHISYTSPPLITSHCTPPHASSCVLYTGHLL